MSDDVPTQQAAAPERLIGRRRLFAAASAPRELLRIAYRDPEHLCERMMMFASHRLAEPSRDWVQRSRSQDPAADVRAIANRLGARSARVAGFEGAVAGTPFYVALVPGYINYLWQEIRMTLRLAALYGHDPAALHTAAEVLWMRGVYPDLASATAGLLAIRDQPLPAKPVSRRPIAMWIRSVYRVLIFGGFLPPPTGQHGWRGRLSVLSIVASFAITWVITAIFPATLMIAMAWGCDTHSRRLFRTTADYYAGASTPTRSTRQIAADMRRPTRRQVAHSVAFTVSILIPIGFLAYVAHIKNHAGLTPVTALGLLVAISMVIAFAAYGRR